MLLSSASSGNTVACSVSSVLPCASSNVLLFSIIVLTFVSSIFIVSFVTSPSFVFTITSYSFPIFTFKSFDTLCLSVVIVKVVPSSFGNVILSISLSLSIFINIFANC